MAGEVVVEGAVLTCPMGSATASLVVISQDVLTVDGMLAATIEDCTSLVNIPTFGTCSLLTAEAAGTSMPCVPVISSVWTPGSLVQSVEGMNLLTMPAELVCDVGGCISVTDSGQVLEESE